MQYCGQEGSYLDSESQEYILLKKALKELL